MKKLKNMFLAVTLGISMLPCFSGEAYTYDMDELRQNLDNPQATPELKRVLVNLGIDIDSEEGKKRIESIKESDVDGSFGLIIIDRDIKSALAKCQPAVYEDDNVKIIIGLDLMGSLVKKTPNQPENSVRVINANVSRPYMGMSKFDFVYIYTITGFSLNVINKTNEVVEIDLGKSLASVNNIIVPLYDNKSFLKVNNLLRPRIVAPNDSMSESVTFMTIDNKGNIKPCFYLLTDTEMMGTYTLVINNKEITFPLSSILDSSKLSFKYTE